MPFDWLTGSAFFTISAFYRVLRVQKEEDEAQRKQLEVVMKREQKQQELVRRKAMEVSQLQVGSSSSFPSSPVTRTIQLTSHSLFVNRRTPRTLSPWRTWTSALRKLWIIPRITTLPSTKREEW